MGSNKTVLFKISSMDGLGQGVSKVTDKITFIEKTLPGEEGVAEVLSEKKGVAFARPVSIEIHSPERVIEECPHFKNCPSCHFLHSSYEFELATKKSSLGRLFHKLPHPEINVVGAPHRLHYRNRVQLHYDIGLKKLGMLDARKNEIIEVPLCKIGNDAVSLSITSLYSQDWRLLAPKGQKRGHVEIYDSPTGPQVTWNQPYSHGGFTQVYGKMNSALKTELKSILSGKSNFDLLDLFAGNGNLSDNLNYSSRLCVDVYDRVVRSPFMNQDLYHRSALNNVREKLSSRGQKVDVLLLDPPRSGLKDLAAWIETFNPSTVAYISCDPNTLVRDLSALKGLKITSLSLFDFFPSTFHYETMVILERK